MFLFYIFIIKFFVEMEQNQSINCSWENAQENIKNTVENIKISKKPVILVHEYIQTMTGKQISVTRNSAVCGGLSLVVDCFMCKRCDGCTTQEANLYKDLEVDGAT